MSPPYPFKWIPVTPEEMGERRTFFGPGSNQLNMVKSEPMGIYMNEEMTKYAETIYNFKVRPDDVWLITYPKCGTTWTQVIINAA
jgi:estrone sulfotransferase